MILRFAHGFCHTALLAAGLALAVLLAVTLRLDAPQDSAVEHSPEALGYAITGAPKVLYRWQQWARAHERRGGDRNVLYTLSDPKSDPPLRGRVQLDLFSGTVRAQLAGLPAGESVELWLVDDVGGPGNAAGVDPQDRRLRVGTLEPGERGVLSLDRNLGPQAFESFEADLVAISRAGTGADTPLISAQTGFFQTLYTGLRTGSVFEPSFDRAPGWGTNTAFAQRAPNAGRSEDFELEDLTIDAQVVIDELVARGADLFFNETFGGNGRTCGTCHPRSNNLTLDDEFIGSLPDDDPLFVGEFNPALEGIDNPELLRIASAVGLLEDGLDNPRVQRSVPHIFGLETTVDRLPDEVAFDGIGDGGIPRPLERTGWGGDLGSADGGDGSLRNVANGAIATLFPKTLELRAGTDFRLPTAAELDAIEAFYRALGRVNDPLNASKVTFANEAAERGKVLFFRTDTQNGTLQAGKCSVCHNNFGGNLDPAFFAAGNAQLEAQLGLRSNGNFDTGVEQDPETQFLRSEIGSEPDGGFGTLPLTTCSAPDVRGGMPPGGFGSITQPDSLAVMVGINRPGDCVAAFNTPPLIESVDTPPFFHSGILFDIEEVPMFYSTDPFSNSDAGQFLARRDSANQGGEIVVQAINLEEDGIIDIGVTLRVVNGDENLAQVEELVAGALSQRAMQNPEVIAPLLRQAMFELDDFQLVAAGLQEDVDEFVGQATELLQTAVDGEAGSPAQRRALTQSRQRLSRARNAFFVGPLRLYTDAMPRAPEVK